MYVQNFFLLGKIQFTYSYLAHQDSTSQNTIAMNHQVLEEIFYKYEQHATRALQLHYETPSLKICWECSS